MSSEEQLKTWSRDAIDSPIPTDGHLDDDLIARALDGSHTFNRTELAHLAACVECRDVVGDAAALSPPPQVKRRWWWAWLAVPVAAAAAAFLIVPSSEYSSRGNGDVHNEASVTFLATDPQGRTRDLRPGDPLALHDRLGFRFGNPKGRASTLTILGWDGTTLHWYYPDGPGKSAHQLHKGDAQSTRLPFDFALGPDHRPGELTLGFAFDVEPGVLADELRTGRRKNGTRINVQIKE